MDANELYKIEFLDLSGVDELEKQRVRASLQQHDSSVQLPWIQTNSKISTFGIKKTINNNHNVPKSIPKSLQSIVPVTPISKNIYVNSLEERYQGPVISHHTLPQPHFLLFNNVSPTPVRPFTLSQVNHILEPQNTLPPYSSLEEPYQAQAPVNLLENVANSNVTQEQQIVANPTLATNDFANNSVVQTSSVESENDLKPKENSSATPSPANKSWASLFNSCKSGEARFSGNQEELEKVVYKVSETNSNESICPIRHPKASQFIDPDCYRMGEFVNSYIVDGRAVSLQPRGLINQSNYCYINSILQALIACPPFYNLMASLAQNITSNEKRKPTPVIDGVCRFVKEFKQLPANMRVNNRRSDVKNQKKDQGLLINTDLPFEPAWIYKMLNGIRSDLIEGRQEDAEEFLGCLLNGLNDEMLELKKLVKNGCDDGLGAKLKSVSENDANLDKEWQVMGPKNKGSVTRRTDFGRTLISDIFGGFLKSRIHRAGDHITENIQPFFTLQLNIEKVKTVREALEALVTKYQLEGLTSSKTNEEVEAWQQVMLDELPVILILHLKCFDFKLDGCTKIIKALEFPIDLKVDSKLLSSKTQTPKEKQYKLFAVVYHDGKEASKGHYVTDAFHVGYSSWLRYDDASVKPVQEEHVLKPQGTRVPYLLFYRRGDTIRSK